MLESCPAIGFWGAIVLSQPSKSKGEKRGAFDYHPVTYRPSCCKANPSFGHSALRPSYTLPLYVHFLCAVISASSYLRLPQSQSCLPSLLSTSRRRRTRSLYWRKAISADQAGGCVSSRSYRDQSKTTETPFFPILPVRAPAIILCGSKLLTPSDQADHPTLASQSDIIPHHGEPGGSIP